jgi:glycine/D-amino acid oxidase-like deaminating enzyme
MLSVDNFVFYQRSFMQPHLSTTHTLSPQPLTQTYQTQIPWWSDISAEVLRELTLSPLPIKQPHFDVIVIGGGVAGLSAALSARTTGASVLLLEKEPSLGYGATGRNAGILSAGINMGLTELPLDSPERAFWPQTTAILRQLITESAQEHSVLKAQFTGSLSLAENKTAARHLQHEVKQRQALGLQAELWSPAQVEAFTTSRLNTSSIKQAMWLPEEGRIQPLTLLAHLAHQARQAGVLLSGESQVLDWQEISAGETGSHWQITLSDNSHLRATYLIHAVGPTSKPNARIYALAFVLDLPETFPLFWDAAPYTYADYRPGNGRIGVSGGRYGHAGITKKDANYYRTLITATHHWLPELIGHVPQYQWAVDLYVAAQLIPTLRKIGHKAQGWSIEGLGSLGVLPALVLAQHLAELINHP